MSPEHKKLELEDVQCMGVTYFSELQIYIDKNLSMELMRQTVIHELIHAFLFSYGIHVECGNSKDTEEAFCDFCGAHFDNLQKIVNKIIGNWKKNNRDLLK
ncbi:MAG: hypothetical protein NC452_11700 [Eubacterium sp.]|nr:hypothetical protein [Eubacterium sp.]